MDNKYTIQDLRDIWGNNYDASKDVKPNKDSDVLFADVSGSGYEESAFALFVKDGKLYEVNDSHCSCNGFENYDPEETSKEALLMRKFSFWGGDDTADVHAAIAKLDSK